MVHGAALEYEMAAMDSLSLCTALAVLHCK